jgi:hypothetical protein
MQILGFLVLMATGLYLLVVNFSSSTALYRCETAATAGPVERFALQIEDYRWWVGLWSEYEGRALIEDPDGLVFYLRQGVEGPETWTFHGDTSGSERYVIFSKLSGRTVIQHGDRRLEGTCTT